MAAESWGLGATAAAAAVKRPDARRADRFFVNAAVFIGMSVLAMLVVTVYLVYEVQTLKHPEHMPNANLLYVSLLEIPRSGTLVLGGGYASGAGADGMFRVSDVPEAALVLGARCHCCGAGAGGGSGAHNGTDACALVACRLDHDQIVLETAVPATPVSASVQARRCYALLDHAAAWTRDAHWLRRTVDALARERHVP